jgi:hypothetical protein
MFFRFRIIPAYLRLHILNPADVLILPRQLAESRAPADIIMGPGTDPDVIDPRPDLFNPFKDIVSPIILPHCNIRFRGSAIVRFHIQTAMTALLADKTFRWHSTS